ncbi:MAG TPA: IS1182 family transposase [Candidatus Angelobacter sp.]
MASPEEESRLPLVRIEAIAEEAELSSPTAEPPRIPRLKAIERDQMILHPVVVEDLLEPDHPARAIWELVGGLDLSRFYTHIKSIEGIAGQDALDPHLLICLWIYAYSERVSSAREISRRCEYHPAYQWLTGMKSVNYHSLASFRVQYKEALDGLLAQILAVIQSQNLIRLERVMQDGTKIQAAASKASLHREKTLQQHLEEAQKRVQEMEQEAAKDNPERSARQRAAQERAARERLQRMEAAMEELAQVQAERAGETPPEECRVSETEPETRKMKHADGSFSPGYNVQVSTDATAGLIVGVEVIQAANDQGQLGPGLDEVQRQCQQMPQQAVVDDGYVSRATVLEMEQRGVELIGSGNLEEKRNPEKAASNCARRGVTAAFYPQEFRYDAERDLYVCPAGQELPHRAVKHDREGVERHQYRAKASTCRACPFQKQCCPTAGKYIQQGRLIVRSQNEPAVVAFVEKMKTPEAQAIYRQRKQIAEFPNLWIKEKLGLRRFHVRGLIKVGCEVLWACLTYNIQQWIRLHWRPKLVTAVA